MGCHVIDGPDRSRLLIDVPTGILIDIRSTDITPAIGSVSLSTFTGNSPFPQPLSTSCLVSSLRSSITTTVARASALFVLLEGVGVGHPSLNILRVGLLNVRPVVKRTKGSGGRLLPSTSTSADTK